MAKTDEKKGRFALIAIIAFLMVFMGTKPVHTDAATIVASGTCGDELTWVLDEDGLLTISGTGEITGYPWFNYRLQIKSISIGNSVTSIGDNAFYGCQNLVNISIPNSVTSIGSGAFQLCENLVNVSIPSSVTSIDDEAFRDCQNLVNISIPNSVISIGGYTFYECTKLTNITLPNNLTTINDGTFHGCQSLKTITIPNKVTSIGEGAFENCINLTSITIPSSTTLIDARAFGNCKNLKKIVMPSSVKKIAYYAFGYCRSLSKVYYSGSKNSWLKINIESNNDYLIDSIIICNSTGPINLSTKITKIKNTSKGVKLTWKKTSGASGYYVCRTSSDTISYTTPIAICKGSSKTSYVDTSAKNGKTYIYYVYPYKGNKTGSWKNQIRFLKTKTIKITSLKNQSTRKIKITWKKLSQGICYQIYCSTKKDFSKNTYEAIIASGTSHVTFNNLKKGKIYYIKIRGFKHSSSGEDYFTEWSNVKKIKITK